MTAIGTTVSAYSQSGVSRAAIRADLARYEHKLSDCVNCASAQTPEGKRNIQDLNTQISTLKAQLNVVPRPASAASTDEAVSATASPTATGRLDVYA